MPKEWLKQKKHGTTIVWKIERRYWQNLKSVEFHKWQIEVREDYMKELAICGTFQYSWHVNNCVYCYQKRDLCRLAHEHKWFVGRWELCFDEESREFIFVKQIMRVRTELNQQPLEAK
jgi:hypothetical protein